MAGKKIIGIGLLLFCYIDNRSKFFTVEELKDKPIIQKTKGMISCPFETHEPKKDCGSYISTVYRLLSEELGINENLVSDIGIFTQEFRLFPDQNIVTLLACGVYRGDPNLTFKPTDSDVRFHGWLTIDEIGKKNTRVETIPLIEYYLKTKYSETIHKAMRQ